MKTIKRVRFGSTFYENIKGECKVITYTDNSFSKIFAITHRLNGDYHNENGPAIIYYENEIVEKEYYHLNGKEYSKENYIKEMRKRRIKRILE